MGDRCRSRFEQILGFMLSFEHIMLSLCHVLKHSEIAFANWHLNSKILAQINEEKVEGNKLFGDGIYEEALLKYDCAIQLAPEMSSSSEIRSTCIRRTKILPFLATCSLHNLFNASLLSEKGFPLLDFEDLTAVLSTLLPVTYNEVQHCFLTVGLVLSEASHNKRSALIEAITVLLEEHNLGVYKALAELIVVMASHCYLVGPSGELFVEYLVRHCAMSDQGIDDLVSSKDLFTPANLYYTFQQWRSEGPNKTTTYENSHYQGTISFFIASGIATTIVPVSGHTNATPMFVFLSDFCFLFSMSHFDVDIKNDFCSSFLFSMSHINVGVKNNF
ncbi:hypothetical protein L1887_07053 [Cichorium endivia]|nr:hypothetical protein L1887_07053 [Cichorium endivia]